MPVLTVVSAERVVPSDDQLADTRRGTPGDHGGVVPAGLAGYVYDGAHYCPACAEDMTVKSGDSGETYRLDHFPSDEHDPDGFGVGIVACTSEVDYPGARCVECRKTLRTNVVIYDSGGAHPTPVVIVNPDDDAVLGKAAVLGDLDLDAPTVDVVWLTAFGPVDPGTLDTVSTEAITKELDD